MILIDPTRIFLSFFLNNRLFSPCKSPQVTVYAPGDLRKASSEASDSIVGFGEGGHVTRHYTENGSFIGQYAPGADTSQRNRWAPIR